MNKYNNKFSLFVCIGTLIMLSIFFLLESVQARQQTNVYLPIMANNPVQHKNVVTDGSFESGPFNSNWNESSTNFGTPICNVADCGNGTGTGPRSGAYWTWFGGIPEYEEGSVSQSFNIPNGTATLTFWLEQIACDSAADYMEVKMDETRVLITYGDNPRCGILGYAKHTVDVSAFADGGSHKLEFHSEIFANNGDSSNFFVDDVTLDVTYYGPGNPPADTSTTIIAPVSTESDSHYGRYRRQ